MHCVSVNRPGECPPKSWIKTCRELDFFMLSDHCMGPAGGSGHPWGVPDGSHTVIYGLLFDVATDLYVKMAQNDPKWPKMAQNRPQQTAILRSASVLKFAPLKVVWGLGVP